MESEHFLNGMLI